MKRRTRHPAIPRDPRPVSAFVPPAHVQRLVHVAHPVYEELESLTRGADTLFPSREVAQDMRDVPERGEDVLVRSTLPALWAREGAGIRGHVVERIDVVHRCSVAILRLAADLVCPGGNGCEMTWGICFGARMKGGRGGAVARVKNVAYCLENGFGEVYLGNCRDNLVTGRTPSINGWCAREHRSEDKGLQRRSAHGGSEEKAERGNEGLVDSWVVCGETVQCLWYQSLRILYGPNVASETLYFRVKHWRQISTRTEKRRRRGDRTCVDMNTKTKAGDRRSSERVPPLTQSRRLFVSRLSKPRIWGLCHHFRSDMSQKREICGV